MIVVLVYRPEAADNGFGLHAENPFDGIETFGVFYDAEQVAVMELIETTRTENPTWHFHIMPGEKLKVGFNVITVPNPPKRRR